MFSKKLNLFNSNWTKILPLTILSIITFLVYLPTLKYPFIYDDMPTIIENIHIIKGNFLNKKTVFGFIRWLTRIIHSFIYKIWRENPTPFRIINLLIHITIGILIFFILLKLFSKIKNNKFLKNNAYSISILSSAMFLLHPAQTQTVTYITQMSLEGITTLFVFLVIFCFVYGTYAKNKISKYLLYATSIILTIFSAGTKEIIIVLPPLVLLIDIFFIAQGNWQSIKKRIIFHILIWVALLGTITIQGFPPTKIVINAINNPINNNRGNILTQKPGNKITASIYFISQFKVLLHYLRIYFWPFPLAFEYGYKLSTGFWSIDVILPMITILLILLLAFWGFIRNKSNPLSFGLAWFFISMFPRASFIRSTELICDYKTYIASFGILFFISISFIYLFNFILNFRKYPKQKPQIISFVLGILIFSFLSSNQSKIWKNELTYWGHAIKISPNKARLYNNYGVALSNKKRIEESIKSYKKACECDPTYAEPVINLAFHYQAQGKDNLAMEQYKKAMNMNEFHPEMYLNLGSLHLMKKRYEQALICFDLALKYKPYYSRVLFNKAIALEELNRLEPALECYLQGLQGDYQTTEFYYRAGKLAQKLQKYDIALQNLEFVKAHNQNYYDTVFRLASIYYQIRDYKNAAINFESEYKKHPNNKILVYNLAQSYLNLKEYNRALSLFDICQKEPQTFPYAKLHIAKCYKELNEKEKAIITLNDLIKKPPHQGVLQDSINLLKSITI